jgi:hypothetical protein
MRWVYWRLWPLVVAFFLSACASTSSSINEVSPYPSSWPSLQTQADDAACPNISGTFGGEAVEHTPNTQNAPLSLLGAVKRVTDKALEDRLTEIERYGPDKTVTIAQQHDSLNIAFRDKAGKATNVMFERFRLLGADWEKRNLTKYECHEYSEGPGLTFMANIDHIAGFSPIYGAGKDTMVTLFRATDGSLVLRWQLQSFGVSILLIGSYLENKSVWLKFATAQPP